MRLKLDFAFVALMLITMVSIAWWWSSARTDQTQAIGLRPNNEAVLALGAEVYRTECASCHGENLEGQPNWKSRGDDGLLPAPPHDETGHTWHHPDQILFDITKFGVAKAANLTDYESAMPAYVDLLSDEEIIAVLSWIKAQWPPEIQARHNLMNERYTSEKD